MNMIAKEQFKKYNTLFGYKFSFRFKVTCLTFGAEIRNNNKTHLYFFEYINVWKLKYLSKSCLELGLKKICLQIELSGKCGELYNRPSMLVSYRGFP